MMPNILTLRINRRAVGAAVLVGDELAVRDGRHLSSKPAKTVEAAKRFIGYLLEVTKPSLVVVDAPSGATDSVTAQIGAALDNLIADRALETMRVSKSEILAAYGIRGVKSRLEVREVVRHYWPELGMVRGRVEPYVVDAAAAALYAECRLRLERVPT